MMMMMMMMMMIFTSYNDSGMSTVPEVLTAVHADISVLAISLVTNICKDQDHSDTGDVVQEIKETVNRRKVKFLELVTRTILRLQEN